MLPAKLFLRTGEIFEGKAPEWVTGIHYGEIVFNTGMVGYTEILTDPSYKGQIVCFTYPVIGNYGVENHKYFQSNKIHVSGIIVSELAGFHARNQNTSLKMWCKQNKTLVLTDVDTRALVKVLRYRGVIEGAVTIGESLPNNYPNISNLDLVPQVTIDKPVIHGCGKKKLILVDCGMKKNIWNYFCKYTHLKLKRVPYDYDYTKENYNGVFISNGPGDPKRCGATIDILKKSMEKFPYRAIFGVCLGLQIIGIAIGAKTYKLQFGHRAQNHPCLIEGTNKSYLTSQNHSFAVDESSIPRTWEVWFRNLNDNTVQGMKHKSLPYSSVQFHPEGGPGPMDTIWLFHRFIGQL